MGLLGSEGVEDLVFALLVTSLTSLSASLCRRLLFPRRDYEPNLVLWHFTASLEFTVFACEVNYILWESYPLWMYMGAIFLFSLYQELALIPQGQDEGQDEGQRSDGVTEYGVGVGNPVDTLHLWLCDKQESSLLAVIHILAQVGGACVAYPLVVRPLWTGQVIGHLHSEQIHSSSWTTAVFEPNPTLSALSEAAVTCGMHLVSLGVGELFQEWGVAHRKLEICVRVTLNTVLYSAGSLWSGGFYNPAVATALEGGLTSSPGGVTVASKFWIYWVAPLFGITVAICIQSWLPLRTRHDQRRPSRSRDHPHAH